MFCISLSQNCSSLVCFIYLCIYLQVLCSPCYVNDLMGFNKCMYLYQDNEYFHHPGSHLCSRSKMFFKIGEFCCYETSYKMTHTVCVPLSLASLLSMSAKCIHVIVCDCRFWFLSSFQVVFRCIDVQNLLIYSPANEH